MYLENRVWQLAFYKIGKNERNLGRKPVMVCFSRVPEIRIAT